MENQEFEKELKRFIGLNNKLEDSSVSVDEDMKNSTDQDIFAIACGGMEDSEETYGKLTGWKGLNDVLNEYFDNM